MHQGNNFRLRESQITDRNDQIIQVQEINQDSILN
jgi:hypothetical protein